MQKTRHRWEGLITLKFTEVICMGLDGLCLAQEREREVALVNTVTNIRTHESRGFLSISVCTCFWSRILLLVVHNFRERHA
jgi:hypothetical protein